MLTDFFAPGKVVNKIKMTKYVISKTKRLTSTHNQHSSSEGPGHSDSPSVEILSPIDPIPSHREGQEPGNRIPYEIREAAARAVLIEGRSARDVGKEYGVSKNIMTVIVREFFAEFIDMRNMQLASRLDDVTEQMLKRLRDNVESIPVGQLAVAMGICLDKRQILAGKMIHAPGNLSLKIAWKDGSGAAELTVGGGGKRE